MTTERPILFSAPMVRAILDGRKTQTRRVLKGAPPATTQWLNGLERDNYRWWPASGSDYTGGSVLCPYGEPGDRLWVRETFCLRDPEHHPERGYWYAATDDVDNPRWTPSIHMPRRASRLTLAVTAVRVERLQEISEADARAEGVTPFTPPHGHVSPDQRVPGAGFDDARLGDQPHRLPFAHLWDSINGDRAAWESNPWVWVVEFKRVTEGATAP